jgi:hypothetical protein
MKYRHVIEFHPTTPYLGASSQTLLKSRRLDDNDVCMRPMEPLTTARADVLEKLLYIPPNPQSQSVPT